MPLGEDGLLRQEQVKKSLDSARARADANTEALKH